jgi:hypothetical protein
LKNASHGGNKPTQIRTEGASIVELLVDLAEKPHLSMMRHGNPITRVEHREERADNNAKQVLRQLPVFSCGGPTLG